MRQSKPRTHWGLRLLRSTVAGVLPLLFTALMPHLPGASSAVVTLCLVGFILAVSAWWGWQAALVATLAGGVGLNLHYFAPINDLRIARSEDLMTFLVFNAVCLSASHFWSRSRREKQRAEERGAELENLQQLSSTMLSMADLDESIREALEQVQIRFSFNAVALFELSRDACVYSPASAAGSIDIQDMRTSAVQRCVIARANRDTCVVPLISAGAPIGSLGVRGQGAAPTLTNSIANVLALGLGRLMALRNSTKAEAARRSEEMKATVLDALAHNFKTPLTSVRAAVSALREIPSMYPEQARELLSVAEEETEKLQAMIAEAIETARIDARRQHLRKIAIPVPVAIERALESVGTNLRRHEVHFDFPDHLPCLHADPDLLNHVLIQLLDNAGKYSTDCAIIVISANELPGGVAISISNPGPGIPADEAKHVFERFFRGRATSTRVAGAGIGLSIAKSIMDAHGGSISVVSVPNMTTTFRITLPLQDGLEEMTPDREKVASR